MPRRWLLPMSLSLLTLPGCSVEPSTFYFPSREAFLTPLYARDVTLAGPGGLSIHGWFMPAADSTPGQRRPAILHVHGNAGNVSSHADFSRFLTHRGFHVFVFDYRGYGRSEASPNPLNRHDLLADARAALDHLRSRDDVATDQVAVLGVSLGGVLGLALAAEQPAVRCVVSVSAFDSWRRIAAHHAPFLGGLLIPPGLDAVDSVAGLGRRPLLIVHGEHDDIVPIACAERIAAAATAAGVPVHLHRQSAGHNDVLIDDDLAQERVAAFLCQSLALP